MAVRILSATAGAHPRSQVRRTHWESQVYCLGEWWVCERMPVASTDMKVGGCLSYARSIGNARPAQAFIFVISKTVIREF